MTNNTVSEKNETVAPPEGEKFISPVVSVRETPDSYTVELEMPGVNKDGLEISIEDDELSVTGRKENPAPEGTLVHRESRADNYRRSLELDPSIDSIRISARISQGVVTLTLPKAEDVRPRKIAVS